MKFPESKTAHELCKGQGLEIGGSAHNPFGLNTKNVDLSDDMTTVFKQEEVKLIGQTMPVDIVASGDSIPLPDNSVDFVVSSHVLEHFTNPIKAILEWLRVVRPGGIVLMIVPHMDRTFDKGRPRTTLIHVITDYVTSCSEPHGDTTGHDHVWVTKDVLDILGWMLIGTRASFDIVKVLDVDDKVGNGFLIAIKKVVAQDE